MKAAPRSLAVALAFVASLTVGPAVSLGQASKKQPAGSITGRVTIGGKPAPRVVVLLSPAERFASGMQNPPAIKATTDEDGRYRLTGVEAGNYRILPHAPAFVASEAGAELNATVSIVEGDEAEDIDFSLKRGGVITGRVRDAEGKPVIGQRIDFARVDEQGRKTQFYTANQFMFVSDDRGVYRMYGLAPGHYKVSMGDAPDSGMIRVGSPGASYTRTFHPDVVEEARARIIDVTAGGEVAGVDIGMGRTAKTFVASGRIVDAETGAPVPDLRYGYGGVSADKKSLGSYGTTNNRTNSNGEFRIEGLAPGRYATFGFAEGQSEFYSEPAVFDVADSDVSQLEVKVRRGSSISGDAVLEGTDDPEALAKLSKLDIRAFVQSQELSMPSMAPARVGLDGSFRIGGLKPGMTRLQLGNYPPIKGLVLLRVEREGVDETDGIEIGQGEIVTGVRVVLGYGAASVRGQVKIEGGEKPSNARIIVSARQLDSKVSFYSGSTQIADARGRFRLEGLVPGDYEVLVRLMAPPPSPGVPPSSMAPRQASKNVLVTNGAEAEVTIVLNLGEKEKESEK